MRSMSAFSGFYEAPITFPPTYKYFRDKDEYDVSKRSGVRRVPSYADRVLYCCDPSIGTTKLLPKKSNIIESLKYKSYPTVRGTDHRPMALMSAVATYETIETSIERIRDLRDVGMSDSQIAEQLSSELGVSLDEEEEVLYRCVCFQWLSPLLVRVVFRLLLLSNYNIYSLFVIKLKQ